MRNALHLRTSPTTSGVKELGTIDPLKSVLPCDHDDSHPEHSLSKVLRDSHPPASVMLQANEEQDVIRQFKEGTLQGNSTGSALVRRQHLILQGLN